MSDTFQDNARKVRTERVYASPVSLAAADSGRRAQLRCWLAPWRATGGSSTYREFGTCGHGASRSSSRS